MVASAVAEQFYLGFRQRHVMRAMNANVKLRKSRQLPPETARNVLEIDVGGTHIKVYPIGRRQPIKIDSGPAMTPKKIIQAVRTAVDGCRYDVVPRLPRAGRAWEATSQSCESWPWLGWV